MIPHCASNIVRFGNWIKGTKIRNEKHSIFDWFIALSFDIWHLVSIWLCSMLVRHNQTAFYFHGYICFAQIDILMVKFANISAYKNSSKSVVLHTFSVATSFDLVWGFLVWGSSKWIKIGKSEMERKKGSKLFYKVVDWQSGHRKPCAFLWKLNARTIQAPRKFWNELLIHIFHRHTNTHTHTDTALICLAFFRFFTL